MKAMNRGSRCCAALLVLLLCAGMSAAQKLQIPPHEKLTLKNGMTILLLEKKGVPIVSIAGIVKAGATADPAGQEGLAELTAGLLRKGAKTRSAQQYAADIDFIGGTFTASASLDSTSLFSEFLTKDTNKGLELFADALMHPTFPKEEAEKLVAQSVDEVKSSKDSAQAVIFDYYMGYLYDGKGYGRPSSGDELSLTKLNREAAVKFYETYYTPGNTILAVAGDFNKAEMKAKLEEVFGAWPAKKAPEVTLAAQPQYKGKKLLLVNKPDATQTFFAIGNVGTAQGDPDRVAIQLINTVFGGRFTSQLNEALRVESGLTYGAQSFFAPEKQPGPFAIFSYTRNETTTQAIDLALKVLEKLHKDGLTKEELASARSYIKGQFPPTIETSGQLARVIASHEFYGLDDSEITELEAKLDAVTPELAKQVIAKHFPMDSLVFVLIGKDEAIGAQAKKYADKQDKKDISAPGFWPGAK